VVAKSGGRQQKEMAMRRKKLARSVMELRGTMRREASRDRLLMLGAAKSKAGRAASLVECKVPEARQRPENRKVKSSRRAVSRSDQ